MPIGLVASPACDIPTRMCRIPFVRPSRPFHPGGRRFESKRLELLGRWTGPDGTAAGHDRRG